MEQLRVKRYIRFHEGYHLDAASFFRLPNDYWDIEDGEIFATLSEKATPRKLNIPKRYLIHTLGPPEIHTRISTEMKNYILSIPESEPDNKIPTSVKEYIDWGSSFKKSEESKKIPDLYKILRYTRSGNRWYTYGNHILYREDSFTEEKILIGSRIAIVEKFRTKKRKCIALHSTKILTGSNSFFFGTLQTVGRLPVERAKNSSDSSLEKEQILAAWFSSTLFLALYLYYRREISGDFGRIKIGDMAHFPCIDPSLISKHDRVSIMKEFKNLMKVELPTIYDQLRTKRLQKLDAAILRGIGIEDISPLLDNLYNDLIDELDRNEPREEEVST